MSRLPPDLQEFIYRYVPTRVALDALLLLRTDPDGRWTAARLAAAMPALTVEAAGDLLAEFHWHGFLVADPAPAFRYRPARPELAALAGRLATLLGQEPALVLGEVTRLEMLSSVRSLADAFRVRKP